MPCRLYRAAANDLDLGGRPRAMGRLIPKRYQHPAFLSFPHQQSWCSRLKRGSPCTRLRPTVTSSPLRLRPRVPREGFGRRPDTAGWQPVRPILRAHASPAVWAGERSRGCSGRPAPSVRPVERPRPQEDSGGLGVGTGRGRGSSSPFRCPSSRLPRPLFQGRLGLSPSSKAVK